MFNRGERSFWNVLGVCIFLFSQDAFVFDILEQNFNYRILHNNWRQPRFDAIMQESMAFSKDESVTLWYVKKFSGVEAPEKVPDESIEYPENFNEISIIDTGDLTTVYEREVFWQAFRNVANNPAGRNLLYRILIERERGGTEDVVLEPFDPDFDALRECALTMHIKWTYDTFSITPFCGTLSFNDTICIMQFCQALARDYCAVGTMESDANADLFHELLHWYHALRAPQRYYDEVFGLYRPIEHTIRTHPICRTIWNCDQDTTDSEILCSAKAWHTHVCNDCTVLDLEELRTIIGVKEQTSIIQSAEGAFLNTFVNGDELSENLFRRFANLPYRIGYQAFNYYEDRTVVERCVALAQSSSSTTWNFLAKNAAWWDCSMSAYADLSNEKGIGKMEIPYKKSATKGIFSTIISDVYYIFKWCYKKIYQQFILMTAGW
ncbi:MAG: hypothetical protein LBF84_02805 [Holosporales bacterium]|nr:hypothetical protein [Holosporales bacterium]